MPLSKLTYRPLTDPSRPFRLPPSRLDDLSHTNAVHNSHDKAIQRRTLVTFLWDSVKEPGMLLPVSFWARLRTLCREIADMII